MRRRFGWVGTIATAAIALGVAGSVAVCFGPPTRAAQACGGFFARPGPSKPSLAHEQVVIVYDEATHTEQFIRQVTFKDGNESFGFVVPTPGRPDVSKVDDAPFTRLRGSFPFAVSGGIGGMGHGQGFGSGGGKGGGGVQVLDTKKVGSFTAFVLSADDDKALAGWLKDNGFSSTPSTDEWLAHYVALKFYYVAMRYDPPKADDKPKEEKPAPTKKPPVKAETIRISFESPAPYYPYMEPKPPADLPSDKRLLELWLITNQPMSPVAISEKDGKRQWVRPLQPGNSFKEGAEDSRVAYALGDELKKLAPSGKASIQSFQDQKFSRVGFGDIVFVPREKTALDDSKKGALAALLPVLDPSLSPRNGGEK